MFGNRTIFAMALGLPPTRVRAWPSILRKGLRSHFVEYNKANMPKKG